MTDDEDYTSDENIEKVLNMMRFTDPQHATAKSARDFLEFYQDFFHEAGHILSDKEMQELYEKFAKKKFYGK